MHKKLPVRKSARLRGYDYSQAGSYFITICVKGRLNLLGQIVGAASGRPQINLSQNGKIVKTWISKIADKYSDIRIENYVIMPNHIHLILSMQNNEQLSHACSSGRVNPAPTISNIIGYFKYQTTKEIGINGFWQRSYHDHIIRDEAQYQKIWQYIDENVLRWEKDCYHTM